MARSFIFSNLSVAPLLQKCRVSEEWLKCGAMKDKYKSRLIWKGNILFMRLSTAICCDTFWKPQTRDCQTLTGRQC